MRYGADASAEVIPLAVSGNRTAENLEPNAYALYVALFREIAVHETADPTWLQSLNIPREPLAAFFGLEETLFQDAALTVTFFDPQWGQREYPLEEGEMREKLNWLAGLTVTVKQSALPYGEPTCVYRLYSPQGRRAGGLPVLPRPAVDRRRPVRRGNGRFPNAVNAAPHG